MTNTHTYIIMIILHVAVPTMDETLFMGMLAFPLTYPPARPVVVVVVSLVEAEVEKLMKEV